jgi:putative spermidine/putrescine transport system ATP-binding protein
MSAAENIAFPLKMRGVNRRERAARVKETLELVHLGEYGHRWPAQLSGGQQQRVALARAIVFNPTVLLMDEPLGALDKKLREALQLEIARVSRTLGVTVVYVTHDQEEALALSDRIAIYRDGVIEQLGTGEDLYERPRSLFVAGFMGESSLFRGRVAIHGSVVELDCPCGCIRLTRERVAPGVADGSSAALVVRPERITVGAAGSSTEAANSVPGVLREVVYLGATRKANVELRDGSTVLARLHPDALGTLAPGDEVAVEWAAEAGVLVPDEGSTPAPAREPEPVSA